jgi:hypothetical protein
MDCVKILHLGNGELLKWIKYHNGVGQANFRNIAMTAVVSCGKFAGIA